MTLLNTRNTLKDWALYYQNKGWVVFPVHSIKNGECTCGNPQCNTQGKHPHIKWRHLTYTHPEQIRKWWTQWPTANIGVKTGEESGIIVLDVDGEKGQQTVQDKEAETQAVARTGSGEGYHFYFKHPDYQVENFVRKLPGLDFRGDGGYVVAPPSNHHSGNTYEWIDPPEGELGQPPEWLTVLLEQKTKTPPREIPNQIPQGERNNTLTSVAGTMRAKGIGPHPIKAALREINTIRCNPPLKPNEIDSIVDSVTKYKPNRDLFPDITPLDHITQIENPKLLDQKIQVQAIVSSTFRSYAVPSQIQATWYDKDGVKHSATKTLDLNDPKNMEIARTTAYTKHRTLANLFPEATKPKIEEKAYRTVYIGRIRPPVLTLEKLGDKLVDERGFEYKDYTIYVVTDKQVKFRASSLMQLTGYVLPDPKTQATTLLATSVEFPESVRQYDPEKLNQLREIYQGKNVEQRLDWVLGNFQKYSKIIGRRNIAEAVLLGFFTPLYIELDEDIQRGWCNILILGDTTTGKTDTVRKWIRLLKKGTLITAETASSVGLTGAATQNDGSGWGVDWGFLVLNDGRILFIDGAQKLYKNQWGALAESERSGVVTIAKAAKDSAYARTRQVKIANPTDPESTKTETKNLEGFLYTVQGTSTFLDYQSVARLDLCVFAKSSDVPAEKVNQIHTEQHDPRLALLGEVLKWVWSNQIHIEYTEEALSHLLNEATKLHSIFFDRQVPLCSIDLKWKLARLAAATAAVTLSTDPEYNTLTVTKQHVEHICRFIREEYTYAGLDQLVEANRKEEITEERVIEIIRSVAVKLCINDDDTPEYQDAYEILKYIAVQYQITKGQVQEKFSLARDNQLRPLFAELNDQGLIRQSRGYVATPELNKLVRLVEHKETEKGTGFSAFSVFSAPKGDIPNQGVKDLVAKAREICDNNGRKMRTDDLFNELDKIGHKYNAASPILREHPDFNFQGLNVFYTGGKN